MPANNVSSSDRFAATETFSCDSLKGFAFDYPLLASLQYTNTVSVDSNECWTRFGSTPIVDHDLLVTSPMMKVVQTIYPTGVLLNKREVAASVVNPQGIPYVAIFNEQGTLTIGYQFFVYDQNFSVSIILDNIPAGFDQPAFWNEVMASFRKTN